MYIQVTLIIEDSHDYTFIMSDEDFDLHYQDRLVSECEKANIDTDKIKIVLTDKIDVPA